LQDCGTTTVFTVEATTKLPAWTEFLEVHYARDAAR
jgi:hypothetical protein